MEDLRIIHTDNGGDIIASLSTAKTSESLSTAVYLSLFSDRDWWGNEIIDTEYKSNITFLQTATLNNSTRRQIETSAEESLKWLVDQQIAQSVVVDAVIVSPGHVKIDVTIVQNTGTLKKLYEIKWSATANEIL